MDRSNHVKILSVEADQSQLEYYVNTLISVSAAGRTAIDIDKDAYRCDLG